MRSKIALLVAVLASALVLPAVPAAAATIHEVHYVPTVDGAKIRVETWRDPTKGAQQPVLLTYSPYNSLYDGPFTDSYMRYVAKGYVRARADVLGTRGSTGCWDYGGPKEQQSGADVVRWLAAQPWSNGNVGMIGGSYDGTTATMVAALGDKVPELKAIVPIAGISRWYGYAYDQGVRYFLNSRTATDEGFDTPLLFDFGFARTIAPDPAQPNFADTVARTLNPCESVRHTEEGYNRTPDYDQFWLERDYRKDAESFRAATFVVHGWQDYNVKQDEGTELYEAIPEDDPTTAKVEGVPFKMLWMSQGDHGGATQGAGFTALLDRFLAQTLKGVDTDVELEPEVRTIGRNSAGATTLQDEAKWPPPATKTLDLYLGRKFDQIPGVPAAGPATATGEYGWLSTEPQNTGPWTHVNAAISEEATLEDPLNREVRNVNGQPVRGHGYYSLFQESAPLTEDVRIAGEAILDTWVNASSPAGGMHLTPLLVEVRPNGDLVLVERGFLNLDYRNGLAKADPKQGWQHARVEFLPQDYTFSKGSRIGLMLQGSNTVWALPGVPGVISYAMGPMTISNQAQITGAKLELPVVKLSRPEALFEGASRNADKARGKR
jgi:X-Pro dipeptidyl-peptidase